MKEIDAEVPKVKLATEEWVRVEIMTINNDIKNGFYDVEKRFHDMEKSIYGVKSEVSQAMTSLTRWMVGLIITTAFAIIAAVLFQGA